MVHGVTIEAGTDRNRFEPYDPVRREQTIADDVRWNEFVVLENVVVISAGRWPGSKLLFVDSRTRTSRPCKP